MRRSEPPKKENLVRINRYLSMCGIASRRKVEQLVLDGKVSVDKKVITDLATKVDPTRNKVFVNGKQVVQTHELIYLVMNKPRDTITTLSDERGRTTVMSLLKSKRRVFPIGRLDRNTTGVLLFTNDGEFANRLMHPRYKMPKSYKVTCEKSVTRDALDQVSKGVRLDDGMTGPADVYVIPGKRGKEIGITIHEGRNRQVRKMFEKLGHEVKKLDRVAYGPITTEGLGRGETRSLTRPEVRNLKMMAGMQSEG